jgi:hypothetical protein
MTSQPTPSLGRIVHTFVDPKTSNGAEIAPAIITRVWDVGTDDRLPYVNIRAMLDSDTPPWWKTSIRIYPDEQAARDATQGVSHPAGGIHAAFWPPRV